MIHEYLRTLTVATLALSALVMPGTQVYGQNKHPDDNGVRCVRYKDDGSLDFFLPGQTTRVTNQNGEDFTLECGSDGNWTLIKTAQPTRNGQTGTGSTYQRP